MQPQCKAIKYFNSNYGQIYKHENNVINISVIPAIIGTKKGILWVFRYQLNVVRRNFIEQFNIFFYKCDQSFRLMSEYNIESYVTYD